MSTLYNGLTAGHMPANIIREIVASRQNFPLNHATEAVRLGYYRKAVTATLTSKKEKGILDLEYTDLYDVVLTAPDHLFTPARLHNWYLLCKEPNNVRAKVVFRDAHSEYLNLVNDPSSDPTVPTGSSLAGFQFKATVDNNLSEIELKWTAGVTPLQAQWIGTNSGSAQTGGSGGTGSSMTPMVNQRQDRQIAGIKQCTIGGAAGVFGGVGDVGLLTQENCKVELSCKIMGDRKSYADLELPGSIGISATIETMQSSLTNEVLQAIQDEYGMPRVQILCQSGMIFDFAAGSVSVVPVFDYGDEQGHMTLTIMGEAEFNSNETTPDVIDIGVTNPKIIQLFKLT